MTLKFDFKLTTNKNQLDSLIDEFRRASNEIIDIGYFKSEPHPHSDLDKPSLALTLEKGSTAAKLPARPVFSMTLAAQKNYVKQMRIALNKTLTGKKAKGSISLALKIVANQYRVDLSKAMNDFSTPKNAASTIAEKGFDDPWINTGIMATTVRIRYKGKLI